ncbi:MAG: hypothetical protein E7582_00810 [Ruminococcaceae bacterium]|nr:hypothetical protein [Oscillospiraceae bacterium]
MKKICLAIGLVSILSLSLTSCRNFEAQNGRYGYYNDRVTDREYNERNMADKTENRIRNSYENAKSNIKNTFDNATEYIGNAMGVR